MNRFAVRSFIALSLVACSAAGAYAATSVSLEASVQSAQKSLEQRQYRRAETTLRKVLDASAVDGTKDAATASAQLLLARVLREAGKESAAAEALAQSYVIYKSLGFVAPEYVAESKALADTFQRIDLALLGSASNVLKNNGAEVSISKSTSGGHVEIKITAPFETSLNNPKVDGVQMEKLVSFDIEALQPGSIHVSNIKGFKIHSIEKNTWANLLDVKTGALDSEGKYDAEVTAGKAGFTKTVAAKLPAKVYEPVEAFSKQLTTFGTVVAIDLPVVTPKAAEPATPAVSEAAANPSAIEAAQPKPVSVEPTPVSAETKPVVVEPKPVSVEPTPVSAEPKPVMVESAPLVETKPTAADEEKADPVTPATPAAEHRKAKTSDDCSEKRKTKTSGGNRDRDRDRDGDDDDDDDDDRKDDQKKNKKDKDD